MPIFHGLSSFFPIKTCNQLGQRSHLQTPNIYDLPWRMFCSTGLGRSAAAGAVARRVGTGAAATYRTFVAAERRGSGRIVFFTASENREEVCGSIHICISAVHIHRYVIIRLYRHVYIHTHIYIYIYTHIQTYTDFSHPRVSVIARHNKLNIKTGYALLCLMNRGCDGVPFSYFPCGRWWMQGTFPGKCFEEGRVPLAPRSLLQSCRVVIQVSVLKYKQICFKNAYCNYPFGYFVLVTCLGGYSRLSEGWLALEASSLSPLWWISTWRLSAQIYSKRLVLPIWHEQIEGRILESRWAQDSPIHCGSRDTKSWMGHQFNGNQVPVLGNYLTNCTACALHIWIPF